jgi:protocatechuate 3,4-dioxygenase alpha subunit
MTRATASQTVGPYFRIGMAWGYVDTIAARAGDRVVAVAGRVVDGDGAPVPDGCLEVWQADRHGRYAGPADAWRGFARVPTDADGRWRVTTIVPGAVAPGHAPHVVVSVFARGLLRRLATRMYFPDEPANATDPVLALVPPERRATLVARWAGGDALVWNVVLQGPGETVFFDH